MGKALFRGCVLYEDDKHTGSESANSMLKKYVPASSPMHMFVRHYMCLQFDHEAADSYEGRRSRVVSDRFTDNSMLFLRKHGRLMKNCHFQTRAVM